MESLERIVEKISDVYQKNLSNDEKYQTVSKLWTEYYEQSSKLGKTSDLAKQLYLLCENECYRINQNPIIKVINQDMVKAAANHLSEVLQSRDKGEMVSISEEEAMILLDWSVYNVRSTLSGFGIDIQRNSLNGFCELSQALSIMPFERLGVKVTKNKASDTFGYGFNHRFGTVCLPVTRDGVIKNEFYLIDATYRQFFSSVRCNEGRYYTLEENTNQVANPDPGYFVNDEEMAKELLANGYIRLTEETARFYGEPFYLSSLKKEEVLAQRNRSFDYYQSILRNNSEYCVLSGDLEGLNIDFPMINHHRGRI